MIRLNTLYSGIIFTTVVDDLPANADSLPTAVLYRDGSASSVTVTITNITTGRYSASFTTDAGWSETDRLVLVVIGTFGGEARELAVWDSGTEPDYKMRGTDNAPTAAAIRSEIDSNSTQLAAIVEDTSTTIPGLINAINQSASRRLTLSTSTAYEIPDSGTVDYSIELRTYDADGALVAATGTPTLTATGGASGSLSANLSAATNPATGIYRWTLTVTAGDTVEQIWLDVSAVLPDATHTARTFSAITDAVAVDFASADRTKLETLYNDWINGGRLDLILDSRASQTSVDDVATDVTTVSGNVSTILARLGAITGTGVNTVLGFFAALFSKSASIPTDISGTADPAADSLEAIRDRGDAAWPTASGFSTHSAADVKTALEASGSKLDHLHQTTEDDGGVRRFSANALEQAPGGGGSVQVGGFDAAALLELIQTDTGETTATAGSVAAIAQGGAVDNSAQLNRIEAQTALISAGRISVIAPTTDGGTYVVYKGSDYRYSATNSTALEIQVSDAGEVLKDLLQDAAKVSSVIFGAGRLNANNQIVGTIDVDNITHASDVTTIPVDITAAATATADASDDYEWHIKAIAPTTGYEVVKVAGTLDLRPERAAVSS